MPKWPGVGERLRQRIIAAGYKRPDGGPDILRFSMAHGFVPTYVYKWANAGVLPDRDNLLRLGQLLNVSPAWLLFGEVGVQATPKTVAGRGKKRPTIAGGSGAAAAAIPSDAADSGPASDKRQRVNLRRPLAKVWGATKTWATSPTYCPLRAS